MIAALLFAASASANAAAALAAVEACAARGQTVTAVIAGSEGEVRALVRGDGAPPHSMDSARRKAYTAASFGQSTEKLATLVNTVPDASGLKQLDNTLFVGGGIPIMAGGKAVGAIGVAGGNAPGIDESCARAGLARLEGK